LGRHIIPQRLPDHVVKPVCAAVRHAQLDGCVLAQGHAGGAVVVGAVAVLFLEWEGAAAVVSFAHDSSPSGSPRNPANCARSIRSCWPAARALASNRISAMRSMSSRNSSRTLRNSISPGLDGPPHSDILLTNSAVVLGLSALR